MERLKSYNVQIWIGLRKKYSRKVYSMDRVRKICDEWVNEIGDCVTITPTEFRYLNGNEPGVIIGYIQYPRFPRSADEIDERAIELAERLMLKLKQNRVTITTPRDSIMLINSELRGN